MKRRLRPGQPRALYLSAALTLLLTIIVGVAGLISKFFGLVIFALLFVVSVLLFIAWRSAIVLYYVRAGESGMKDWHDPQIGGAKLGRWPSTWAKTLTRPENLDGLTVEEQVAPVDDLVSALASQARTDKTCWQLTPNLLAPVGIALGYELMDIPKYATATLVERMGRPLDHIPRQDNSVSQPSDTHSTTVMRPPGEYYPWLLSRTTASPHACPGLEVRTDGNVGRGALIIADLTDRDATTRPGNITFSKRYRIAAFRTPGRDIDADRRTVKIGDAGADALGHLLCDPGAMVQQLGALIREVVHETPEGPVYLAVRLTKTVSVAVGHYLRISRCGVAGCRLPRCQDPWKVLVPLNYNRDQGTYSAWRVSKHQPSAHSIVDLMGTGKHHA